MLDDLVVVQILQLLMIADNHSSPISYSNFDMLVSWAEPKVIDVHEPHGLVFQQCLFYTQIGYFLNSEHFAEFLFCVQYLTICVEIAPASSMMYRKYLELSWLFIEA